MLRTMLLPNTLTLPSEPWTLRGLNPGRLESFSDSTFSFGLTLLIITLEVPKSYDQLIALLPQFFSFIACFAILTILWHRHVVFFRRYGLHDSRTVGINTGLLALVLFYLYPLKFLMNTVGDVWFYAATRHLGAARPPGLAAAGMMPRILAVYLLGFAGVSLAFVLLHRRALALRQELKLSAFEEAATLDDLVLWLVSVGSAVAGGVWNLVMPADLASFGTFLLFAIPLTRRIQRRRRAAALKSARPS